MADKSINKAVERFIKGDAKAFDYIYDKTYKVVYFVIYGIVKNRTHTLDLVQETYLKAFKNLSASFVADNFVAWITTMAKNIAINEYNRLKREKLTDFVAENNYIESDFRMPDEDSFGLIKLAQEKLDETDYKIVVMCVISGYRRREVAEILGMPISTVSYRLQSALDTLKKNLQGGRA